MKEHTLEFVTHDDWEPLEPTCWTECPFACLTGLGHECRARKAYRKDKLMICPVVRFSGEFQEKEVCYGKKRNTWICS